MEDIMYSEDKKKYPKKAKNMEEGAFGMSSALEDKLNMMNLAAKFSPAGANMTSPLNRLQPGTDQLKAVRNALVPGMAYGAVANALKEDSEQIDEISRDLATRTAQAAAAKADNNKLPTDKRKKNERMRELAVKKVLGYAKVNAVPRMSEEAMEEETTRPLAEKTLTKAEMAKREELAKKMKKGDWSDRYGDRGKSVMYATATKMAKKLAEAGTVAPGAEAAAKYWADKGMPAKEGGITPPPASPPQAKTDIRSFAPAKQNLPPPSPIKAGVGLFSGRPTPQISSNKPNLQQRQADIAKMSPQTSSTAPSAVSVRATPAKIDPNMSTIRAADIASMKNVNVADLNRIQGSNLSGFGKAFQTARSLQGIKSNAADPNSATGKNFAYKGKQYGVIRKDEK